MSKRLTREEFIEKAMKVHSDKYDYSLVEYKNNDTKIKIICKNCSDTFEQFPHNHLNGKNCKKCSVNGTKLTLSDFVKKSIEIHGDKYDYSSVNYINNRTKVKILCKKCSRVFEQIPNSHLLGFNCPLCAGKYKTTEIFIDEANKIHHNKYDYSKFKYVSIFKKAIIICPKHGNFLQRPNDHINREEDKNIIYGKSCEWI